MIRKFKEYWGTRIYWLIRTDEPYFSAGLNKLNVPKYDIDKFSHYATEKGKNSKVYILKSMTDKDSEISWSWAPISQNLDNRAKYKGEVEVTNNDIDNWNEIKDILDITDNYNL